MEVYDVIEAEGVSVAPILEELDASLTSAVSRLIRRLRAEKSHERISDAQRTALALLVKGGPCTLSELSELERVKPPSMNQTVNALVELGYVERRDDPSDGRKVILAADSFGVCRSSKRPVADFTRGYRPNSSNSRLRSVRYWTRPYPSSRRSQTRERFCALALFDAALAALQVAGPY